MASTNKTTNLQLSQYVGTDKPTYLGDYNSDMLKIDTASGELGTAIQTVASNLSITDGHVGSLANLTTTDKTSVVNAINEVDSNCDSNTTSIGTLSNLETTNKSTVVNAINEVNAKIIPDTYSSSEIETNKIWIDDKPIYRKIIVLENFAVSNGVSYNHNIANIDTITTYNAHIKVVSSGNIMEYPTVGSAGKSLNVYVGPTAISWSGDDSWSASDNVGHIFIIEYTKTSI